MDETAVDVAVVGAGPIGIELAVALKRAGIDYVHFDARQIGYTISWFAPQTRFFSSNERIAIAGVPLQTPDQSKATREEYLAYLRSMVQQYDLDIRTYEPVTGIERAGGDFVLTTQPRSGRRICRARSLVLCTGGTERPRRLNIPGEDLPHVSAYFQDPHTYFRKRLLIVGGKNSAVEAALRCHHAGAHVSLSYRRAALEAGSIKYWLLPEINGLIEAGRIAAHFRTLPLKIGPAAVKLASLDHSGGIQELGFDFVLLLIGYEADMSLLKLAGVQLINAGQSPVYDPATMQTTVPNLYVAGTAIGGTQDRYTVFLENCHVHVARIMASLTGAAPPVTPPPPARAES